MSELLTSQSEVPIYGLLIFGGLMVWAGWILRMAVDGWRRDDSD